MIDSNFHQNMYLEGLDTSFLLSIINKCFQCGSCAGACPLRKVSDFNPRKIIHKALMGEPLSNDDITKCLTCNHCFEVCPQGIDIAEFIRQIRKEIVLNEENFAHHNIFNLVQIFMTKMTESGMKLDYKGEFDSNSKIAYFSGCADLFDRFLDLKKTNFHQIGQSAVSLMNKIGEKPILLPLKCCGHDAYWTGDEETYKNLRDYNTKLIKESGISTLVLSCAECYYTFSKLYKIPKVNIQHISQFIEEHQEKLKFNGTDAKITYHDPCRLGRFMKEYESPRAVLNKTGIKFKEMAPNKQFTNCCGVSAWLRCDDQSRAIMLNKLKEATQAAGEEGTLIVGCNKCFAHLNCVLEDKKPQHNYKIRVKELGTFIDEISSSK